MTCSACGQPIPDRLGALLVHLLDVLWVDADRHLLPYTRLAALVALGSTVVGCVGVLGLTMTAVLTVLVVVW
jgi:hypothetical protein